MSTNTDGMVIATKDFKVVNELGLHARPAAAFAAIASRFASDVFVQNGTEKVDGKSIIGLLLLTAARGTRLTVHAHGPDAALALTELELLFARRFGETQQGYHRANQQSA